MKLVFDIETNGLSEVIVEKDRAVKEGDKVWCIVTCDVDTGAIRRFTPDLIEEGVNFLRGAELLIGHNIMFFDVPFIERFYGKLDVPIRDTLIVSRMMYPDIKSHPLGNNSLKSWGKFLGNEKIEFEEDFNNYSPEMLTYCEQDVMVNLEIYNYQCKFVKEYPKSVILEHLVSKIIAHQIENGIGFDIDRADRLEQSLAMERVSIEDELCGIFPPIVEERWSDKTGKKLKSKVTYFNPSSRKQIASRLLTKYGWQAPKTDKGNPKVDSEILKKLDFPEAKMLVRSFDITKLMGMVSDWILRATSSRDGRIHGSVNPQGTVTGRMTAKQPNLQQVSSNKDARSLFKPRDGWIQVGIDASSLEARLLANRMYNWDGGDYGDIVIHGDIHAENQIKAGLPDRSSSKTFFFALIYGAGDGKIGSIIGKSRREGKKIKERYLDEMPALKKLIDSVRFQVSKKGTITLLDNREVPCRAEHKALNVQIQGDGAILMKLAQCIFYRALKNKFGDKAEFMATVHDEWQIECDPAIAEEVGKLGVESIRESGKRLKCNIPMDGEFLIGMNWSECH